MPEILFTDSKVSNKPFRVAKDFICVLSNGKYMYIPKGYITDFASVPSILKIFTNNNGRDNEAFVVHDYLYNFAGFYQTKKDYDKDENFIYVNRKFADREMRYQQSVQGSSKLRGFCYYWGVRIGGVFRFNKI